MIHRFRSRSILAAAVILATLLSNFDGLGVARAADYVIHISIDGLNARTMQSVVDAGHAPTFKRLEQESAWTANARTDYTHTITLPNHTCMITGRPVLQPEGMPGAVYHGWVINDTIPEGATLHNTGNPSAGYIASVFDVVHDAGRSTAMYASKDKFVLFDKSYDETTGAANERGRDKIDQFCFMDDGPPMHCAGLNRRFVADMKDRHFNYTFIHYRDTDTAGHATGWESPEYLEAVSAVDGYLGEVLHFVESDATLVGHTVVIVTTDHGGLGKTHSNPALAEDYTIPIFVWGAGVDRGDLYAMNEGGRSDPGGSRPDYLAKPQPIRNGDTGNLALKLLALGPIPGSMINSGQDLRVSWKASVDHAASQSPTGG